MDDEENEEIVDDRGSRRKTFAVVCKGDPNDFADVVERMKAHGLYIVYTRASSKRLVVKDEEY